MKIPIPAAMAVLCIFSFLVACGVRSDSPQANEADVVFTHARVYTVNPDPEWAEAVAVRGNKIVYVGDAAGAAAYQGEATETFDLEGKMLLPGFVSGQDHLIASDWMSYGVSLYDDQ